MANRDAEGSHERLGVGVSVYLDDGPAEVEATLERAVASGMQIAFTSLHIPEEGRLTRADVARVLGLCREAGLLTMADVSPRTLRALGLASLSELAGLGVTHVRCDFGIAPEEAAELTRHLCVVVNASSATPSTLGRLMDAGADRARLSACHNFYPKRLTGLSYAHVRRQNDLLHAMGMRVAAFVPGDARLRGPVAEGLPTLEAHRAHAGDELVLDALELAEAGCDDVLVGDPGLSEGLWERLGQLARGCLELRARLEEPYAWLYGRTMHDRDDPSPWLVRADEWRLWDDAPEPPSASTGARAGEVAKAGTVIVSNASYGRYAGEVELARRPFALDGRDTVAGFVSPHDARFLPHVAGALGVRLVP